MGEFGAHKALKNLKFFVFCFLSFCAFSGTPIVADDSIQPHERAIEIFQQQFDLGLESSDLSRKLERLQRLREHYISAVPEDSLARLKSDYISELIDFCTAEVLLSLNQELLVLFRQDLSHVIPFQESAQGIIRSDRSLREFTHLAATLNTLHKLTGAERADFKNLASPKKWIRPKSSHPELADALTELNFNYDGLSPDQWEVRLLSAFLQMYEKGKGVELEVYEQVRRDILGSKGDEGFVPIPNEDHRLSQQIVAESNLSKQILEEVDKEFQLRVRNEDESIQMKIDDWGRAEVTQAGGVKVIKVVHFKSERAFIWVNVDQVPIDSAHVRKIVARAGVYGGTHREDGQAGRDVTVIGYKNNTAIGYRNTEVVQNFQRPKHRFTPTGARWWLWATMHRIDDKVLAEQLVCAAFQFAIVMAMGGLEIDVFGNPNGKSYEDVLAAAVYTFFYGAVVIGVFIESIIYWEMQTPRAKSEMERRRHIKFKKYVKSLLYAIPFIALIKQKSLLDPAVFIPALIFTEVNARVKSHTQVFTELAEADGLAKRSFYWFGKPKPDDGLLADGREPETQLEKAKVKARQTLNRYREWKYRRIIYNGTEVYLNLPFKVAAFSGLAIQFAVGASVVTLPVGPLAFLAMIPIASYEALQLAKSPHSKLKNRDIQKRQEAWDSIRNTMVNTAEAFIGSFEDIALAAGAHHFTRTRRDGSVFAARLKKRLKLTINGTLSLMEAPVKGLGSLANAGADKIQNQLAAHGTDNPNLYQRIDHGVLSASASAHQGLAQLKDLQLPRWNLTEAEGELNLEPVVIDIEEVVGKPYRGIRKAAIATGIGVFEGCKAALRVLKTSPSHSSAN